MCAGCVLGAMLLNNPLIRPAISWGGPLLDGPLDSYHKGPHHVLAIPSKRASNVAILAWQIGGAWTTPRMASKMDIKSLRIHPHQHVFCTFFLMYSVHMYMQSFLHLHFCIQQLSISTSSQPYVHQNRCKSKLNGGAPSRQEASVLLNTSVPIFPEQSRFNSYSWNTKL